MLLARQATYRFDDFEVDLGRRTLRRGDHVIEIQRETFDLLAVLMAHAPGVMSEAELTAALWPRVEVEESNLGQHIFLLRRALTGAERGEKIIVAAPRGGYRFAAELEEIKEILDEKASAERVAAEEEDAEPILILGPRGRGHRGQTEREDAPRTPRTRVNPRTKTVETNEASVPGWLLRQWKAVQASRGTQMAVAVAAVAVVAVVLAAVWSRMHRKPMTALHLVVTEMRNTTGDPEFDTSLRAAMLADLRQSPYLILPGEDKVVAALVAMNTEGAGSDAAGSDAAKAQAAKPRSIPRELCGRLKSDAYLDGEIRRLGAKYLIVAEVFDCTQGKSLARVRGVADTADHVLPVLDRMAAVMRGQLGEPEASVRQFNQPLFRAEKASIAALKAYAGGSALAMDGRSSEAVGLLQRAVGIDPQFAQAYEELGLVSSSIGQREAADTNLSQAYQLRNAANAFDRFSIVARYDYLVNGDFLAGIRNFNEAIESYPRSPVFLSGLADLENRIGKAALALDPARRAIALEPDNGTAYEVLAEAQMHLGQFEEAALTCRRAISRAIDSAKIHGILLQIAFQRLDQPGIDEQLAWAHGRPEEPEMLVEQGQMEMAQGKVKRAQALFTRAAEGLRTQGRTAQANALLSALPRRYAELGLTDLADAQIGRLSQSVNSTESADVAVARAELGGTEHAASMLKQALDAHPASTLWQQMEGPQIRAAIALNEHEPDAALAALAPALPYDLASFDLPAMRGRAYLMAHQPEQAEAEFHKILDHPGVDPLSQDYPLAQLGLARALAAEGKPVEAGFAYKIVLQIWKDADSDLPRLRDAKAEYARLGGEPGTAAPLKPAAAKPRHR
jgi:DNA-binding winged helix-turn-helix (wHTH) protein/tetratricopeptide (TPR) repeat protein